LPNGERRVLVDPAGQSALTKIVSCDHKEDYSILTIQLMTGRTHQIRVHCQSQGYELIGDTKYGDIDFNKTMKKKGFKRLMLHASRLELPRTEFSDEIVINADTPNVFNQLMNNPR
jgi:23S rRNA pseudouridine955/2504/2580 synthase